MCGIFGFIDKTGHGVNKETLKSMGDSIVHRGPDDEGFYIYNNIGLGMRRLSIIDLTTGHQPLYNENKDIIVILNGEIYNYKRIKDNILTGEHNFRTSSDVEVIIHLYEEKGIDFLNDLNGMFGFSLLDLRKRKLYIIRDRLGIKPVYYYEDKNHFIWASEIKAILSSGLDIDKTIDYEALYYFLNMEYFPGYKTTFSRIKKLAPGHYIEIDIDSGKQIFKRYWDAEFNKNSDNLDFNSALERFGELLRDAVSLRMISDVPFGCFLSGGIDSSVISALMSEITSSEIKTFSLGFGTTKELKWFDELEYSDIVAEHIKSHHSSWIIKGSEVRDALDKILWHFDEPFGRGFHTYFVSKMSKEHVTVALSGLGADEILTGYEKHMKMRNFKYITMFPEFMSQLPLSILHKITKNKKIQKLKAILTRDMHRRYIGWMQVLREDMLNEIITKQFKDKVSEDVINYFQSQWPLSGLSENDSISYLELKTTMVDDFLNYTDKTSMAHSLEVRVPFLDHRLVEFVLGLPFNFKNKGNNAKYILKKMSEKLLPDEIIYRKKHPFFLPLTVWIKDDFKDLIKDTFNSSFIENNPLFNQAGLNNLLNDHISNNRDRSREIWLSFITIRWLENNINN